MGGLDKTTLVTFRLLVTVAAVRLLAKANHYSKCNPKIRYVQLFGSWDNFARPYSLQRDNRVGADQWSGCHTYENIICDGDLQVMARPRRGGLKMGGTYWYYYMLDGIFETVDEAKPTTNVCPLLPGQTVNVLEVPYEAAEEPSRRASLSATTATPDIHTLQPTDRFQKPHPNNDPKRSRVLTSPSILQDNPVQNPIIIQTTCSTPDTNLLPSSPLHLDRPSASREADLVTSLAEEPNLPSDLAGFDFNDFKIQANIDDQNDDILPNEEKWLYGSAVRPQTESQCICSRSQKEHRRCCSWPSARTETSPELLSPLGSHPVSNDHETSFNHYSQSRLRHNLRSADEDRTGSRSDRRKMAQSDELDNSIWPVIPQQSAHENFNSLFEDSEFLSEPTSSHGESAYKRRSGLTFMSSSTCGSLTEDASDDSFVTSSASSDIGIWSPQPSRPVRLQSPPLDFELDRPTTSYSNRSPTNFQSNTNEGFLGYSLPDEAGDSQLTLTKTVTPKATPRISSSHHGYFADEAPQLPIPEIQSSLFDDLSFLGGAIS
ncbi:MAG: hypothetical protein M1820_003553 [Bogoriella megaspora]|nr:MAG: hypothetical protein M1820_003553 [Bogoriella megaspora]